jgi:hypothetical protein
MALLLFDFLVYGFVFGGWLLFFFFLWEEEGKEAKGEPWQTVFWGCCLIYLSIVVVYPFQQQGLDHA